MFWSMVRPKKLKLVTCFTGLAALASNDKLSVSIILQCLKNSINFDLATFSTSLLLRS